MTSRAIGSAANTNEHRRSCAAAAPGSGWRRAALYAAGVFLLAACGGGAGPDVIGPKEGVGHPMAGRRAPDFVAQDPSGSWLPSSSLKDRPIALLFFRPGAPFAPDLAREMGRMRADPTFQSIVFLGITRESLDRIKEFIRIQRLSLPILRDPDTIARDYGIGDVPTVVLIDGDGIVRFRMEGYLGRQFQPRLNATEAALRELPRLGAPKGIAFDLAYTEHPRAPVFSARDMDGKKVDLASFKGRVVVLNFFDQDCPHCQRDLPLMAPVLREFRSRGVVAIGVASRDVGGQMRRFLKDHGVDWPVVIDPARDIFRQYDSSRTPDTFFIDRDGFVRFREHGDRTDRADLTRLELRLLLGEEPKALAASLPKDRYVGDGACRTCHEREYADWLLTPHSIAWDSLEKGEKWRDHECVGCHVTGRDHPGGYVDPEKTPQMLNVQCEVCHGVGGGHPAGVAGAPLEPSAMKGICASCHTGKFVLNFDPDEALALVAHQDHPDLDKLFQYSDAQRQRLEAINTRRLEKFKSGVAYVGGAACRDCHAAEYEQWNRTPHAAAFAVILQAGRGHDPTCTPCHTTGMGHKGGFGDQAASGGAMTHVQCEVCHGPGGDHVKAPAPLKKSTIYGITDQCSFCIIQGVCATCHDQANDPKFDIERALPLVRHRPGPAPASNRPATGRSGTR
ncbi:MAG TPA: redoxin domain-containing protein [Candidatus Polarisedimenticolia bacterium]|nr:redoxin domain-containing protein [Candidatus Polarisedimenticolia bacterium]